MRRLTRLFAFALALVLAASCSDGSSDEGKGQRPKADNPGATARPAIVFNGQGNNLDAYLAEPPFTHQRVITNHGDDPKGLDINAQICFFGGGKRFIAGEDTGQPNPPQGWGIFDLKGDTVGRLSAAKVGKLTPTYQGSRDNAENYGCGFLRDGRVLTTDVGNQATGPGDGQLIVWFPPFDTTNVRYCKIDVAITTAGGIMVDDQDRVYVASARPPGNGVLRYTGPFPTSATADGGCGRKDATGAPLASAVHKEVFLAAGGPVATPNAIARSPKGTFYVSSILNGVISEVDASGKVLRTVLQPPANEKLGEKPFSTGTPLGLAVGPDGSIYFADLGLVLNDKGIGPGDRTGTVRRIRFVEGRPQPPETMATGLAFPDGIGILPGRG